ncbi:thiamine-phosphate pyrophosphorylase [Spirochaetota bacterium]
MDNYRIVDANLNRLREALRVIEEIFRFINNDKKAAAELKGLRHRFSVKQSYIAKYTSELISHRDIRKDTMKNVTTRTEKNKKTVREIFLSNIGRAEESLRVIEEFAKLFSKELSGAAKKTRYDIYKFEKKHYKDITD